MSSAASAFSVLAADAKALTWSEWVQCDLAPDLDLVRQALDRLAIYVRERGLDAESSRNLELAVAEGLNNAIEHGCTDASTALIRLRWTWSGEILEVRIGDPGAFSPKLDSTDLPQEPLSESGRGLYLMSTLVDEVEHSLVPTGHELILRKKVGLAIPPVQAMEELQKTIETIAEDLHVTYEDFSSLLRLSEFLATAESFDAFAAVACGRLRELLPGAVCCVRLVQPDGRLEMIYGENQRPLPLDLASDRFCVETEVARTRSEQKIDDCAVLPDSDPLHVVPGCAFVDPIVFRDKLLGVFSVTRQDGSPAFSEMQANLVRSVCDFLGIALTTLSLHGQRSLQQRAMRELEIAATIQTSLLPRSFPENSNYRIFGISRSAAQVGGDYFDVLPVRNIGALLVIADVMGKGVPAALLATIFRTAVHCRLDVATRPGLLLRAVNQQISDDLYHLDMFITAQVAYLSYETHRLHLANAGHCPLLRIPGDPSASVERYGEQGYPLGLGGEIRFKETVIPVAPGDRFLFLTDGIYEVENHAGEMLGVDRLAPEVARLWSGAPEQLCGDLFEYLNAYAGGAPAADDRTLLTLQRNP